MKKYKLIEIYPGSPELGTIATPSGGGGIVYNGKSFESSSEGDIFTKKIVNCPKFWQEVVDPEFEVTSYIYPDDGFIFYRIDERNFNGRFERPLDEGILKNNRKVKIHSVKRLSDTEIFVIGEKAKTIGKYPHTVSSIEIKQKCIDRNRNTGGWNYDGVDRIWLNWENDCGGNWMESSERVRDPLFVTEDGVNIFGSETIFSLSKETLDINEDVIFDTIPIGFDEFWIFKDQKAAEDFCEKEIKLLVDEFMEMVLFNTPILSLNDLLDVWGDGSKEVYKTALLFKKFQALAEAKITEVI